MKTRNSFLIAVHARLPWLRTTVLAAVTLSLVLFSGCAQKKVPQITHAAFSTTPTVVTGGSTNMYRLFGQLRIGMSEHQIASTVEPAFYRTETDTFLGKYPFRDLLPEVAPRVVTEWRTSQVQPDGWPEVLFAVFEDASKTNLVDAFSFKEGSLTPVVDGVFGRNIRSIKPGDSMDTVYRLLGKRSGDYFRGANSKWRVKFVYWTYRGRIFVIEADAAEGQVIRIGDGTI